MIITAPLRRMTLHFSQIGLTDGLTFIAIPSRNFAFRQSRLRKFAIYAIFMIFVICNDR
jgi:hypothetical protein